MAHFRCPCCQCEGTFIYRGQTACPVCRSSRWDLAISMEELLGVHPDAFDDIDREIAEFEHLTRH